MSSRASWAAALLLACSPIASAGPGHYVPNQQSLRSTLVPESAIYLDYRAHSYFSRTYRDQDGREDSNALRLRAYSLSLSMLVVPVDLADIGLRIGFGADARYTNGGFSLRVIKPEDVNEGDLSYGDSKFTPLWVGWNVPHLDLSLSYSFYAPIGDYERDEDLDAGKGFWTHELQLTVGLYLDAERYFGLLLRGTYEAHGKTEGRAVTQGDNLTFEYGWSQRLFEYRKFTMGLSVLGYSWFQVQADRFAGVPPPANRDSRMRVHGLGGEVWFANDPMGLSLVVMGAWEYGAHNASEGWRIGLNVNLALPPFRKRLPKE